MSFLRHKEPHQPDERLKRSYVMTERARPRGHALAHRADESPVGCSWRVALQQSPRPLNQPRLIVGERSVEGKNFFQPGADGLNFLSHYRGAPHTEQPHEVSTVELANPSDELYRLASEYLVGSGKPLQDAVKAISLYESAAKLGCSSAYLTLGNIFRAGTFVKMNPPKAIEYYEKGIAHGDNRCWAEMAGIFHLEHFSNWEKCWANYFSSDDFLQNIEHPNSIDRTSNRLYSFGYICQLGTLVALGRDIEIKTYLTPIINHIHLDPAYSEEVAEFCRKGIDPRFGKEWKESNKFYGLVLKQLYGIPVNQGSLENKEAQSASDITTEKSFWSRMFGRR